MNITNVRNKNMSKEVVEEIRRIDNRKDFNPRPRTRRQRTAYNGFRKQKKVKKTLPFLAKLGMVWHKPKWAVFGLVIGIVIATVGSVGALNGWFGGGGSIPEDTMTRGLVGYWNFDEGSGTVAYDMSAYGNDISISIEVAGGCVDGHVDNGDGTCTGTYYSDADNSIYSAGDDNYSTLDYVRVGDISPSISNTTRGLVRFDLSDMPSSATVSSATLSLYEYLHGNNGGPSSFTHYLHRILKNWVEDESKWSVYSTGNAWSTAGCGGSGTDYDSDVSAELGLDTTPANDYVDFTGSTLTDDVQKFIDGTYSNYGWRLYSPDQEYQAAGVYNYQEFYSKEKGGDNRPKLVVVYSDTTTGNLARTTGKIGRALQFDGVDDYADVGSVYNGVKSVEFWVKPDNTTNKIMDLSNTAYIEVDDTTITATNWTSPTIYVNGVKNSTTIATSTWAHVVITTNTDINATSTEFGRVIDGYFDGTLDEIRFYNRVLSDAEVRYHYNGGGPIAHWKFDEGSGSTAYDSTDNNVDLFPTWDLRTTSYDSIYFSVAAQDTQNFNITFKPDGTQMYTAGQNSNTIYQYSLSPAWDLTTAFYDSISTSTPVTPYMLVFNSDGTKMYLTTSFTNIVYQYSLSSAWDVSTASYNVYFTLTGQNDDPVGIAFKPDGTQMYIVEFSKAVYQYSLSSAWDLSTAYYDNVSFNTSGQNSSPYGIAFKPDGTKMYISAINSDFVYQYSLSSAWDVSTASYDSIFFDTPSRIIGITFKPDGTKMYGIGNSDLVYQYSVGGVNSYVTGKQDTALSFDGVDDYLVSDDNITGASTFSHSFWFKSTDGAYSADEYLFSQGTDDPSVYLESVDNKVKVMADGALKLSSSKTVNDSEWHHVEITADGSTIKLYLDGKLESKADYTGSSATETFSLGVNAVTPAKCFGGTLDDVRIYNYARTAAQIQQDYNAGLAAHFGPQSSCDDDPGACMTQGLVGYWNFDEGSGSAVHDISGNSKNSTSSGSQWTSGKVGGALQFDGTDDNIGIGDVGSIQTVEFWLNNSNATDGILELIDNNTFVSISSSAISLTGFTNSTAYINGVEATALSSGWNHIVVVADAVSAATFRLGEANGNYMAGKIDEVKIYNRALSPSEVRYHYNGGGPIAHWKFDEGSGSTAYDASGNGNSGTVYTVSSATQTLSPGTMADDASVGTVEWTNPDNAKISDNIYSTVQTLSINTSHYLKATNFGFSLPPDSTIIGILVEAEGMTSSGTFNINGYIVKAGTPIIGSSKLVSWNTIEQYRNYGSSSDLWGELWGVDDINHVGFGCALRDQNTFYDSIVYVDHIRITVYYTGAVAAAGDWASGKYGTALSFNGTDDYISAGDVYNGVKTISFWMKADNLSRDIIGLGNATTSVSSGTITTSGITSPTIYVDGKRSSAIDTGWHHVLITTDAGINVSDVNIGKGTSSYFDGILDDVKLYNYARSPAQIQQDYNAGLAAYFGPKTNCDSDPGACMTEGLVGYWDMEDRSGSFTLDKSGNENSGTLYWMSTSSSAWTTGVVPVSGGKKGGSALSFDGSDDYLDIGSNDDGVKSVEFWVKADDITSHTDYVIDLNGTDYIKIVNGEVTVNNISNPTYYIDGVSGEQTIPDITGWHHVVVSTATGIDASDLDIGRLEGTGFFDGRLDEVKLYNRALSAAEVRYHYNRGGPVAHWKFDESSGNTAYDSTEKNNDGTLYGEMATSTTHGWTTGKQGSALSFDGVDDYVNTSLDLSSTAFTLEAWIKTPLNYSADNFRGILDKRSVSAEWFFRVRPNTQKLYFSGADSTAATVKEVTGETTLTANSWYHAAVTYNGKTATLYLNGKNDGSSHQGNAIRDTASVIRIGTDNFDSDRYWDGLIDDVRIYNYARTPSQIQQDYNMGLSAHFK